MGTILHTTDGHGWVVDDEGVILATAALVQPVQLAEDELPSGAVDI